MFGYCGLFNNGYPNNVKTDSLNPDGFRPFMRFLGEREDETKTPVEDMEVLELNEDDIKIDGKTTLKISGGSVGKLEL